MISFHLRSLPLVFALLAGGSVVSAEELQPADRPIHEVVDH